MPRVGHKLHDRFFRRIFSRAANIAALLRAHLPRRLQCWLDLQSIDPASEDLTGVGLRGRLADKLYALRLSGGARKALIHLEHQRTARRRLALALLRDRLRIWQRSAGAGPLPPIITVVVYNGRTPWSAPTDLAGLLGGPPGLHRSFGNDLATFCFQLIDLRRASDHRLLAGGAAGLALLLMKWIDDPRLPEMLPGWSPAFAELRRTEAGCDDFDAMLTYLMKASEAMTEELLQAFLERTVGQAAEEARMTIGLEIEEKGRKEGLKEGKKEGLKEGKKEGLKEGRRRTLIEQLEAKFGSLPPVERARIEQADEPVLARWTRRVLDAATLDQVLDAATLDQALGDAPIRG